MSVESMAIALHHSKAKGTPKIVLLGIANHDGDGGAWPSKQTLAHYANVDVRNVDRAIAALVAMREIRVAVNAGGKSNTPDYLRPNLYHFLLECPPYCDRSRQHRDTRKSARYVPRYLDIALEEEPPGESAPGGAAAARPPARAPGDPGALPPPELNQEPAENLPSSYDPNARAHAGYRDDIERSAPPPKPHPQTRDERDAVGPARWTVCPQQKFLPCSYSSTTHLCLSCGTPDPAHIADEVGADPTTGEVPDPTTSKEDSHAVAS